MKYNCPASSVESHGLDHRIMYVWVFPTWLFQYGCVTLYMLCLEAEMHLFSLLG